MQTSFMFGKLKGKSVKYYPFFKINQSKTRPTTAMARSVIFNTVLHSPIFEHINPKNAKVLDLCCGTGMIGFEFASIEFASVTFVDSDFLALKNIQQNAKELDIEDRITTLSLNAPITSKIQKYDIVFFDPPYKENELINKQLLYLENIMQKEGVLVLEIDKSAKIQMPDFLKIIKTKKVNSKTTILFIQFV